MCYILSIIFVYILYIVFLLNWTAYEKLQVSKWNALVLVRIGSIIEGTQPVVRVFLQNSSVLMTLHLSYFKTIYIYNSI